MPLLQALASELRGWGRGQGVRPAGRETGGEQQKTQKRRGRWASLSLHRAPAPPERGHVLVQGAVREEGPGRGRRCLTTGHSQPQGSGEGGRRTRIFYSFDLVWFVVGVFLVFFLSFLNHEHVLPL